MGKKDGTNKASGVSYYTLFVKFSRRVPNPLNIRKLKCILVIFTRAFVYYVLINLEDEVRAIYSDVVNVRRPRQKNARWILIDFETSEHAEACKKILEEKKHVSLCLPVCHSLLQQINFLIDLYVTCKSEKVKY